jgi:tRNA(fMet)-specific endonuclease VapC
MSVLLDSDTLIDVLRQRNPCVAARAASYLKSQGKFTFSSLTRYEVLRGLILRNAHVQLISFHTFCHNSQILSLSQVVLDRAAQLWAEGWQLGESVQDADLIIAASALEAGLALATSNTAHFSWINGLVIEDWRLP